MGYTLVTGAYMMMACNAGAAQQVKDIAENATKNIKAVKLLLLALASLVGLCLFLFGLYLFHKNSQQPGQDHAKKGFIACIVGVALLVAPFLIGVGAESLSSGQADTANEAIENDARF